MAGTDAGWPAELDFVEYVQARQRTLQRAAFLVTGDPQLAEDLLRAALVRLAGHWDQVRDEQPDAFVRRALYRDAIASWRARRPEGDVAAAPTDVARDVPVDTWEAEEARRRAEVLDALDALTPRQRAVVVLRAFDERGERDAAEVLGWSVATVRAQGDEALPALRAGITDPWPADAPSPLTEEVRELLELAADDLADVDFAEQAWAQARWRHRSVVRRTVLGSGLVAAAAAVVAVVVREPPPDPLRAPPSAAATTAGADGRLAFVEVDGITVFMAPDPRAEGRLPPYPGADELAIPRHLGPGDPTTRAVLGEGGLAGVSEPVRAVFLVGAEGRRLNPVLYAPGAAVTHILVPGIQLRLPDGSPPAMDPRAVAEDRHRIVFHQSGRVVVLDARDGSVVEVEVPDPTLKTAGWARDGVTVVARGRDDNWLIDPGRGVVRHSDDPVHADWADLADVDGSPLLRTYSGRGELTGSRELRGPPVLPTGPSVSNTEGWVAVGAFLPDTVQRDVERTQGLVAVQGDLRPVPRVLAATRSALVPNACYRPLAWGPQDVILFEARSERAGFQGTVRRVLAWDVIGARLWRVADVDRAASGVGEFTGMYTG
ncbi:hypothetical protein GCM10023168_15160 [Fodinibacter luteus]|uniref:RNA polymerase sigma factor 70 region 4 type 2 domain-containing protein n=1 Tax=Fodinibacter luteus TaxID=552064 RepID=A0ABP8KCG6_9MICO